MAIVTLPAPIILSPMSTAIGGTGATMNLATEESFLIGQVFFPARTDSKTISAAGSGRIFWVSASGVTFANGGTNLRVGIQDVAATGLPDGTFDVFADLVGGTDTITSSVLQNTLMESGTKSLSYGQTIAIGMEMTTRAGADQVTQDRVDLTYAFGGAQTVTFPYGVHLGAKSPIIPQFLIKFDDGTFGWIYNAGLLWNTNNTGPVEISFNSGSTPDEYAGIISFAVDVQIDGIGVSVGAVASADDFELILYSDPLGTPAVIESVAPDPDFIGVANNTPYYRLLSTPRTLTAGTKYGIALRPTTANNITWGYLDLTTGFNELKNGQPFTTIQMASRTDNTGAFSETQTYHLPLISVGMGGFQAAGGGQLINAGKVR